MWACVLELNAIRRRRGAMPVVNYQALCRELSASGPGCFGELSSTGARSILRRYADAWMTTAARRRAGEASARYPRRKKALVPSCYYAGTFRLEGRSLWLPVARGAAPLVVRLSRDVPYPPSAIRSVTLLAEGPRLAVDVTAEIEVECHAPGQGPDPERVAGVDLGIIHPFSLVADDGALVVSGRALRAETRLHLSESKARHRRRLAQARHEAAKAVVDFARERRIGTLVVGDPRGLLGRDAGPRQNLATRAWRVGRLMGALRDKAEVAGIDVVLVDERGNSSTCPRCSVPVPKPKGRVFSCAQCDLRAHRDVVGAINIASRSPRGGIDVDPSGLTITHRRAGRHLPGRTRRDPRRVAMDNHDHPMGPWPAVARPEDDGPGESLA